MTATQTSRNNITALGPPPRQHHQRHTGRSMYRVLYEGFAYRYHQKDPSWDKLLKGRSAHLITTCDAPSIWVWWQYRNSDLNTVKRATLGFCGIAPVKVTRLDRVKYSDAKKREKWVQALVDGIEDVRGG